MGFPENYAFLWIPPIFLVLMHLGTSAVRFLPLISQKSNVQNSPTHTKLGLF